MLSDIIRETAVRFAVDAADIVSPTRAAPVARARFAAVYVAGMVTNLSVVAIGQGVGKRDHSTILHAMTRARALRAEDPVFRRQTDDMVSSFSRGVTPAIFLI